MPCPSIVNLMAFSLKLPPQMSPTQTNQPPTYTSVENLFTTSLTNCLIKPQGSMTWLLFSMIRVIKTPRMSCKSKLAKYITFIFFNYDSSNLSLVKIQQNNYDLFKIVREPGFTKTHK